MSSQPNSATPNLTTNNKKNVKSLGTMIKDSIGIFSIVIIWVLAGIAAFIFSLYCFSKSGTTAEKVVGVLLAIILGPFYFVYAATYQSYCR